MRKRTHVLIAAGWGLALTLSACSGAGTGGDSSRLAQQANRPKAGVILPDSTTSTRWDNVDRRWLQTALAAAGMDAEIQNANGDVARFAVLADEMINNKVKVLVLTEITPESAAAVEKKARAAGIPTIDYDRLTLGGSANYYVSFDGVRVGALQGEGIAKCLTTKHAPNIVELEGAPTDANSNLFYQGQQQVLGPKYGSGDYKLVASRWIDDWNTQKSGQAFEQVLAANRNKIDGVVATNDAFAGAAIDVLKRNGLSGKVAVTGQDATPAALRSILRGEQCMTVYKPIRDEAEAAATLAIALARGDSASADTLAGSSTKDVNGNRDVKSVLLAPSSITIDGLKKLVNDDAINSSALCAGDTAPLCQAAGITS